MPRPAQDGKGERNMAKKAKKVVLNLAVTSTLPPKKVAALIDRLIAVGLDEANDSLDDEHDEDAEKVISF
jgi:hypothetical protein